METLSNVASAASKAIWGEQNTTQGNETSGNEPISGQQGKGTVEEPFDQGNAADPAEPTSKADVNPTTTETISNPTTSNTETASNPITTTTNTHETSKPAMNPSPAATGGEPNPLENTEGTGVTGTTQKYEPRGGDVIPSESSNNPGTVPSSGEAPTVEHHGAGKPSAAPTGGEASAVKESKEDAEDALLTKRDPNDHSGEPMHMHGGNEIPSTQEERRESKVGMPGGQEHGAEPKGTGEQWVKSSGQRADGGDFDASKPGAGKEADRILESKGIHKDATGAMEEPAPSTGSAGKSGEKEKVPLGEKIKNKLHIGHKDK